MHQDNLTKKISPIVKYEDPELLYQARSPEVQEIIGRMPTWVIRWGITVIGIILLGILIASYWVKYPETINTKIIVSYSESPILIKANTSGITKKVFVKEGSFVQPGELLLLLENSAYYSDIKKLQLFCQQIDTTASVEGIISALKPPGTLQVGELKSLYSDLIMDIYAYKNLDGSSERKIEHLIQIRTSAKKVLVGVENWEHKFALKSSIYGKVSFFRQLGEKSYINAEETILAIIPPLGMKPQVTGKITSAGKRSVSIGQTVLIALDAYPVQEFGFIKGTVKNISPIEINGESIISVELSDELKTTNNINIPIQSQFFGSAEIVVKNKSILNRLFDRAKI